MTNSPAHWSNLLVTDAPELETLLRDRADRLSSRELAEYAHSLGLYPPPGFDEGKNPPIALAWPAWMPDDADGVLVWDTGDGDE